MILGLVPILGAAQKSVHGRVIAPTSEGSEVIEPLVGATVFWSKTSIGTLTDIDGHFEIEATLLSDSLVVSYVGYKTQVIKYTGQEGVDVKLTLGSLGTVDVEYERHSTEMSLMNVLNVQELDEKELCKAACCNLSESFETNASIDASFTDAVTGTRQIRMLGLDGKYSQITKDNIPLIRGLSTIYGLNYVPGPWIKSIQISKGVGSVTGGYESITGQINVAMKGPSSEEKMHVNAFVNQAGRLELNTVNHFDVSKRWSTSLLTHGEFSDRRWDNNGDGFIDEPLKKDIIVRNEWLLKSKRVFGSYQATYLVQNHLSGQMGYQANSETVNPWGASIKTERIEAHAKTGLTYPGQEWKSWGSQLSFSQYDIQSELGGKTYDGFQRSYRVNLLFASRFNEDHKFTTGFSYVQDEFDENFRGAELSSFFVQDELDDSLRIVTGFSRMERVPGVFFEYTWSKPELFSVVAGVRGDQHNLYGSLFSPRLHARYSLSEKASIKLGAGIGHRTANIVMENVGLQASNRDWRIQGLSAAANFGLPMETAANLGLNYLQKFRLFYRDASISVDFYHTEFTNQLVIDMDQNAQQVNIYALDGQSYSNSAQIEMHMSPMKRFDVRLAHRWLDVQTDYVAERRSKPFVATHRALINLAYETKAKGNGAQWRFDGTIQWVGPARIPDTFMNPQEFQVAEQSSGFTLINAQVTRVFFEDFEVYLGGENLANFQQPNPILSAEDPGGEYFDASLVWGPIFGRMAYAGMRWTLR